MSLTSVLLAAQAITASDLGRDRFYVAGIEQGMTLSEYNSMISNGSFLSKPTGPDGYWATIDRKDYFVTFCQGRVMRVIAGYDAVEWHKSIKLLTENGYKIGIPYVSVSDGSGGMVTSSMAFETTLPKGAKYFVTPLMKGASINGRSMPDFQLSFQAYPSACQ